MNFLSKESYYPECPNPDVFLLRRAFSRERAPPLPGQQRRHQGHRSLHAARGRTLPAGDAVRLDPDCHRHLRRLGGRPLEDHQHSVPSPSARCAAGARLLDMGQDHTVWTKLPCVRSMLSFFNHLCVYVSPFHSWEEIRMIIKILTE